MQSQKEKKGEIHGNLHLQRASNITHYKYHIPQLLMHRTKWFMAFHIEKDTDR